MKTRMLLFLFGCLVALAAWSVHDPNPVNADPIPEKYLETINKGLEYLVKNQLADGHWEGDAGNHPVAMTGLVGIALLMEKDASRRHRGRFGGPEPVEPKAKFSANIRKAADWLMEKAQSGRDGLLFSGHASEADRYMQGHGLAVMFLAGACKDERDDARRKKLGDVLDRAVKFIVKAQSSQGGWHVTSRVEGHDFDSLAATAMQVQALQAAESAGIAVPSQVLSDALQYLKTSLEKNDKATPNRVRPVDVAAALACTFPSDPIVFNGRADVVEKKDTQRRQWLERCQADIPVGRDIKFGRDELAHYYLAQGASNLGAEAWERYRTPVFDHLKSSQNHDGSWPGSEGFGVGPVHSTAVWCTVLQLDKRSHPSTPRPILVEITTSRELNLLRAVASVTAAARRMS